MQLSTLDWGLIGAFFLLSLIIGLVVSKRSGESASEYFLSGRSMPWWLLGFSMVATTFSADTPNLVTDIVRKNGVAGNWQWWAFLLTGMLTVFVYAKLWRRSGVLTDLEFYELRYSGKAASFLRGFRAVYLGVFFNAMIMATVSLAAIKIGGVLLGLTPVQTILIASVVTVVYTSLGGLTGVIWTDFFQFIIAMVGTVWAAMVVINQPEIGGVSNLLSHPNVSGSLSIVPDFNDMDALLPLFILPLAVQWWSVWYPGAEPGGGGYIAQRMLSAKNETHAITATLFFNFMHYALRPWPWILVALASLIFLPKDSPEAQKAAAEQLKSQEITAIVKQMEADPASVDPATQDKIWALRFQKDGTTAIREAFPDKNYVPNDKVGHDLAYPAMMRKLPSGLLGLIVAALIAAYMSTIATHLNWGSSYVVNDFYKRFVKPQASEKELVNVGKLSTVILMVFSALLALALTSALQMFNILLQIGAGTGLIFILRWFWWRINAWSEISAMVISFVVACVFEFGMPDLPAHVKLLAGIGITTVGWIAVTFLTQPTSQKTLLSFYKLIKPHASGWKPVIANGQADGQLQTSEVVAGKLPLELLCMVAGCFMVYAVLFGIGFMVYGEMAKAGLALVVALLTGFVLVRSWSQVKGDDSE